MRHFGATTFLAIMLTAGACFAQVDVDFNFPPPPDEGAADYLTIAEDGEARAAIVFPAEYESEEIRAARSLQQYLELVTGATLPVIADGAEAPEGLVQIHIGDTTVASQVDLALPDVRYGAHALPNINGYLVQTLDPQSLIIRGRTPQATILGVIGFLRQYAGVRRYWPGDPGGIGDVVPDRPTLTVPQVTWRDWPYFISRIMSGLDNRGPQTDASRWSKFADFWRMNYTIPSNESYYKLLDAANRRDEPDIFPLIGGERFIPSVDERGRIAHGWQPCVSNPRVAEIMTQTLIEAFEEDPDRIAMNLAVNDGLGDCTCEECRAMDPPGTDVANRIGLTDRYVKFDNEVAEAVGERFADRILAFLAYGSMREPPTTVDLHPMLMPVLCVWGNAFEMWDQWMATGVEHMGIYLYHDDIRFIMPKMDIHQSAKRLRYIVNSGRARHFYQEFYGIYPLDGMVGYVETELLWDPRLDEDMILDEHYRAFFRGAEKPMRQFYEALEDGYRAWLAEYGLPHPHGKDASSIADSKSLDQFRVLPPEQLAVAEAALTEALVAAEGDERVTARVELVKQLFDFAALGAKMYWPLTRLEEAQPGSMADCEQVLADARAAAEYGLAISDHKFEVIDQQPVADYAGGHGSATLYNDLQPGGTYSRVPSAIGGAFRAAAQYMHAQQGADAAVEWWSAQRQDDLPQMLADLLIVGEFHAAGRELENLVADPSYEQRGANSAQAAEGDADLAPEHEMRQGVNFWHSQGTTTHAKLTDEDARTGEWSFTMTDTKRAGTSHTIPAGSGEVLSMSLWVKHNGGEANYHVDVIPRGEPGMLSRTSVPVPEEPDVWHQVELVFVTPPETQTVGLYLFAEGQHPGDQVFVDDYFIGRYGE